MGLVVVNWLILGLLNVSWVDLREMGRVDVNWVDLGTCRYGLG